MLITMHLDCLVNQHITMDFVCCDEVKGQCDASGLVELEASVERFGGGKLATTA
jgi:hypothetical protein